MSNAKNKFVRNKRKGKRPVKVAGYGQFSWLLRALTADGMATVAPTGTIIITALHRHNTNTIMMENIKSRCLE